MINIIIPTFQAGSQFKFVLQGLRNQTLRHQTSILIIDSGSTDETLSIAQEYDAHIVQINQADFNHGATRNKAIDHTNHPYIALLTQDAVPANQWLLEKMLHSLNQYQAAGVYARQIPQPDASPLVQRDVTQWLSGNPERRIQEIHNMNHFLHMSPFEQYQQCVFDNVASMIRREVWEHIPFPHTPFGEDVEWGFRVLCAGHRLVYEPEAMVIHSHERSTHYVYKRVCVDHYRLNQLFGLRTVPSRYHVVRSFFYTTVRDFGYLMRHPSLTRKWWHNFFTATLYAWASANGQYAGAKMALRGVRLYQSKDV